MTQAWKNTLCIALSTFTWVMSCPPAQAQGTPDSPNAAANESNASPGQATLQRMANRLSAAVTAATQTTSRGDCAYRVRVELPEDAPDSEGLLTALTGRTLAGLRADTHCRRLERISSSETSPDLAQALRTRGFTFFIDFNVRTVAYFLEASVRVWKTQQGGWRDHVERQVFQVGTQFIRQRLNIELRQYLGGRPAVRTTDVRMQQWNLPDQTYLALHTIDFETDGRTEIVGLRRTGVDILQLPRETEATTLEVLQRLSFPSTLQRAAVQRRRPLASAMVHDQTLIFRTTDYAHSIRLSYTRANGASLSESSGPCEGDRYPNENHCLALAEGRDYFTFQVPNDAPSEARNERRHAYAIIQRTLRNAEGEVITIRAWVNRNGQLGVHHGDGRASARGYGTALALADLEDDGSVELLISHASRPQAGDQLSLLRSTANGDLRLVWRSPVLTGSIWVAAHGDIDNDGRHELLAIEERHPSAPGNARLWMIR